MKKEEQEFVKARIKAIYKEKWSDKDKTLQDFADELYMIGEKDTPASTICRWANGQTVPHKKNLKSICRVLGVTVEDILPVSSYEEKYRYSSDYQDEVAEWSLSVAKNCFGLDLSLLEGLKHLIDFGAEFPFFYPLECVLNIQPLEIKYERSVPVSSAEQDKKRGIFQIEVDGKYINLSPVDMKYLGELQKKIVEVVQLHFAEHRQELIDSMNEATKRCQDCLQPGVKIELGRDPLSPEELQKIDGWGIYTEEERRKYKIPDSPEKSPYTAAYKDGTTVHIGRGPLPPDELREFFESKRRKKGGGAGEAVPDGAEQSGDGQVPDSEGQGATVTESSGRQKQKGGSNNGKARKR